MNLAYIKLLYEYNSWANNVTFDVVSSVNEENLIKDLHSSHHSIKETLVHVVSTEWIWLTKWKKISSEVRYWEPSDYPAISDLMQQWLKIEKQQLDFISDLTEEELLEIISYTNKNGETWKYPLWQMMCHVVNHSTYHRGQIIAMLRQLGEQPKATDFLVFIDTKNNTV